MRITENNKKYRIITKEPRRVYTAIVEDEDDNFIKFTDVKGDVFVFNKDAIEEVKTL